MTRPRKIQKVSLDALIGTTLRSTVAGAEPSPEVWESIERKVQQDRLGQAPSQSHTVDFDLRPRFVRS